METKSCCGNCKKFIRHYIIGDAKFMPIDWGHCKENYRYIKLSATDRQGCNNWELCESLPKQKDIEYYVSNFLVTASKIAEVLEVLYKRE